MNEPTFRPEHFRRVDETDDADFYVPPRLVVHIDEPAIAALTAWYATALPADGDVLDLMSSWVSHLPAEVAYRSVTGLGMNRTELEANPRLTTRIVQDLNRDPRLPFPDAAFDACTIAVSVQYLTRPVAVFAEIARVLRPGGLCAVSFSNRMFPTKAVAVWRALDDADHGRLVGLYFRDAGGFEPARFLDLSPHPGATDPLYVVESRRVAGS
ncbi:MAG: class I SAM-dependent methyltransferase [Rhodospirillaceae bacterium]